MNNKITRRNFMKTTGLVGLGLSVGSLKTLAQNSPNEKIVVAIAGIRSRGKELTEKFAELKNCIVKYLVDVDTRYFEDAANVAVKKQGDKPEFVRDFRDVLAKPQVDALVIATPDHWHAPMAIAAANAGKHVYLEKPCGHNPAEGEMLVKVQKKTGKLIQMGNQRRSMKVAQTMIQDIRNGLIGDVYFAKTWYTDNRKTIGFGTKVAVPACLDWDLWQGPAPRTDYRSNVHPYNWHWFWNWGTGEALNNGTHELDVARWALNVDYPKKVTSLGGRWHYVGEDDWQCPDTQNINIEFEGGKAITWEGRSCNKFQVDEDYRGVMLFGTKGTIVYLSNWYKVYDSENKKIKQVGSKEDSSVATTVDPGLMDYHADNFINSIQGKDKLTSPIEEGHKSVLLGHLGNISLRTGRTLNCDTKNGHILDDPESMKLWTRQYEPGWEPKI